MVSNSEITTQSPVSCYAALLMLIYLPSTVDTDTGSEATWQTLRSNNASVYWFSELFISDSNEEELPRLSISE